jgi:DNA primase
LALFPQQFIDDLRLQANIVQVVQDYVPLKKAGTTYKGLCPFHSEKTPSFHVNLEKGFFHCFGCGLGGDVFKFLELHEKVAFPDAVRMLAQKFGVALPEVSDGDDQDARRDASLREGLLKVHELAAAYFREQLAAPAGARARQQLAERDVAAATIDQLGLGFAPVSRDALLQRLRTQGFAENLLLQSGLVVRRDSGEIVDRFRNRLMVPICRDTGSIIAFGGRAMDSDQVPKYLNSPETPIYSKGPDALRAEPVQVPDSGQRLRSISRGVFRFRSGLSGTGGASGGNLRHGVDCAAGAAVAPVHHENRAELRSRRRRPGSRGTIVRTARR